jgi:hypothetical protein
MVMYNPLKGLCRARRAYSDRRGGERGLCQLAKFRGNHTSHAKNEQGGGEGQN